MSMFVIQKVDAFSMKYVLVKSGAKEYNRYNKIFYKKGDIMKLEKNGVAGTLESGDIMVEIRPSDKSGVNVELESTVMNLFGKQIREVILETAKDCGLEDVEIIAHDKGALDCTIRSRVTTAALRATGSKYNW